MKLRLRNLAGARGTATPYVVIKTGAALTDIARKSQRAFGQFVDFGRRFKGVFYNKMRIIRPVKLGARIVFSKHHRKAGPVAAGIFKVTVTAVVF